MDKPVDLVFEGGGVKGIGLAGAFSALWDDGWRPRCVAGASAGAITAALVAAGYSGDELRDTLFEMDFASFKDEGWEDKVVLIGKELSLLRDLGIYEGDRFLAWMQERLEAKGVVRFGDLPRTDDPAMPHPLQVIVSDVTARELLVLPRDARKLGADPDALSIADAVRMSMSIPVFFEPVRRVVDGREHLLVDGGMLSNFPVWLFDAKGRAPRFPTFGLLLVEPPRRELADGRPEDPASRAHTVIDYLKALAQTTLQAHDRMHLDEADFARTIGIPTLGVGTTEFGITPQRKQALYESGRQAVAGFLPFDFEGYVAAYRSGAEVPSRRARVTALMADAAR